MADHLSWWLIPHKCWCKREKERENGGIWNLNCGGAYRHFIWEPWTTHSLLYKKPLLKPPSNITSKGSKFQHTTFCSLQSVNRTKKKKVGIDEKWFQYESFFKEESIMQKTWRVSQRTKRKTIHNQKMCSHASLLAWLKISQHLFNSCFS